jgi:hypothetical protein
VEHVFHAKGNIKSKVKEEKLAPESQGSLHRFLTLPPQGLAAQSGEEGEIYLQP